MTDAIIAYAVANLADILSTNYLLRRGGRELNPVMRWAMDKFGKAWVIPKLALAGAGLWLFVSVNAEWAIWAGAALVGVVAVNNFRLGKGLDE